MMSAREAPTARWQRYSRWSLTWRYAAFINLMYLVLWLARLGLVALGWRWVEPSPPPQTSGQIAEMIFHGLFVGLFGGFLASLVIDRSARPPVPPTVP